MPGAALVDSLLLVIAVAALLAGCGRLAARLTDEPLPRVLATVVLFAAVAVVESLLLGLVGASGSPVALTGLAVVSGAAGWWICPAADTALLPRAVAALRGAGWPGLAAGGAALGLLVAVAVIELRRPVLGQDAVTYHLPEVIGYVQSGHAGRVFNDFYGLPVGNYPITEEVLLSWFTGITHGFSALVLMTLATVPLLVLAGWLGLAELGVAPLPRSLALAALVLVPLVNEAWVQPGTDLEAMTWLVCCGALCLAARRRPELLAVAVVAAGLAIGTKTTVASWSVVMLAFALWYRRGALRAHWRGLLAGLVLAVACGLVWYLRNWVDHGSPLWPFSSFPSGDPRPAIINYLSTSLLQSLHRTLLDHLHPYASAVSGGVVVIIGGILCAVPGAVVGRRRLVIAGVVTLLGALEYAAGPVTGLPPHGSLLVGVVGSTLRYLMPVFAAGVAALALTASDPAPAVRALGLLGLAGTIVWDLVTDLEQRFHLAYDSWIWFGLGVGLAAGLAVWAVAARKVSASSHPSARSRAVSLGSALLAGLITAVILATTSHNFTARHAATPDFAQAVSVYLDTQPGYTDSDITVATSKTGLAPLAGDRLQHPLTVIPQHAACADVARLHARDYIVIAIPPPEDRSGLLAKIAPAGSVVSCVVDARWVPTFDNGDYAVYAPTHPA